MPVEPPFEPLADPDAVATKSFSSGFRGFDQSEVRAYLTSLASALRVVQARQDDLALRLSVAEQRARSTAELEPRQLTALVGEETARVLESARSAAAEIRTKADEAAARQRQEADAYALDVRTRAAADTEQLRAETDAYATETRSQAETASRTMREDADTYAADVRTRADATAAQMRAEAARDAEQLRSEAEAHAAQMRTDAAEVLGVRTAEAEAVAAQIRAEVEQVLAQAEDQAAAEVEVGRQQGRELVARAEAQRDELTREISRRRRAARQQLEQVSAARERLIEAYRTVRDLADRATDELDVALPEARAAAEAAGHVGAPVAEPSGTDPDGLLVDSPDDAEGGAEPAAIAIFDSPSSAGPEPGPESRSHHDSPRLPQDQAAADPFDEGGAAGDRGAQADQPVRASVEKATVDPEPDAPGAPPPLTPHVPSKASAADIDALFARIRASRSDEAVPSETHAASPAPVPPPPSGPAPKLAGEQGLGRGSDLAHRSVDVTDEPADDVPEAEDPTVDAPVPVETSAVETLLERRDGATDEVERSLARRLKRTLADEQNTVLDAVRRAKRAHFADVLPEIEQHQRRYAEAATDDLMAAAAAGRSFYADLEQARSAADSPAETNGNGQGNQSGNSRGVTIVVDTGVADLAEALAAELVAQVRDRVERGFTDGEADTSDADADDRLDEAELTDRIRACYREWKTQRIVDLARHFVLTAFSRGAYDAAPVGACLAWVVDNGGTPCPDAEDNALAGSQAKGEPFPTGHVYPPAHPGCRCLVVPDAVLAEGKAPIPHR